MNRLRYFAAAWGLSLHPPPQMVDERSGMRGSKALFLQIDERSERATPPVSKSCQTQIEISKMIGRLVMEVVEWMWWVWMIDSVSWRKFPFEMVTNERTRPRTCHVWETTRQCWTLRKDETIQTGVLSLLSSIQAKCKINRQHAEVFSLTPFLDQLIRESISLGWNGNFSRRPSHQRAGSSE